MAPTFHAGQWAAQFQIFNGFYGVGAMHFSTPDKAWLLSGRVSAGVQDYNGDDTNSNSEVIALSVGPRWFRPGHSRVRPFVGVGVGGNFSRGHQVSGANTSTNLGFGVGVYGEVGATVFLAPELSVGASWSGNAGYSHSRSYLNGNYTGMMQTFGLSAGDISLEGAIYF